MEPNGYRDFPIHVSRIAPKTRRYHVRVIGPVPGGQPGFNEKETRIYNPAVFLVESGGHSVDLLEAMKIRRVTTTQLYQLGTILSDLLLPGSIRERLFQSLNVVRERKQRLRLRLIIEANELVPLPWEYLYLRPPEVLEHDDLNFLALQSDISIIRHERIDQAEPRLERRGQYRLVAALAAPSEQPALKIVEDRKAIERMLKKVTTIGDVKPVWVKRATRQLLREALRQPTDIFHFAGHGYFDGRSGQIVLDKGDGKKSDFYNASLLANLLRQAGVKLAILGACETAQRSGENIWGGVAPALVRAGLAAVVASQYRLQDRNAIPLAEELYRGVLAGDSVDEAVFNARLSIYQQAGLENRDWGAPVLYLRVEDGVIFPSLAAGADHFRAIPRIAPTPLLTPLIGRDDELATARLGVRNGRKYYFYGTFGIGKTSLVTELFTQAVKEGTFADGYLWCRVAGMGVEQVLEWVASHFPGQEVAQAMGQAAKINALRELLALRQELLIGMDEINDMRVIHALLEAAGNCSLLLNGPRHLQLSGQAQEFELTPLDLDEAEQLFVNLANRSLTSLGIVEREQIQKICERMRYLPLAIKLAALKHAEGESLETLWERLQSAPATIISEHEEVSAIFETVYHDLQGFPAALRLLLRIASFPALEAPLAPLRSNERDLDFFQAKDKLIALGLVSAAGLDRLSLHPLLGLLARQQADPQFMEAERERASNWLLSLAQQHANDYNALEPEHRNLLGTLDWLEQTQKQDMLIALTRCLYDYLRVRGYWQEAYHRLDAALRAAQSLGRPADLAWVYLHRGIIRMLQGGYDEANTDFEQADHLYQQDHDLVGQGLVLYRRANLSALAGKLLLARDQLERALELMGEKASLRDRAGALRRLGTIVAVQGDPGLARRYYQQALALSKLASDREETASVHLAIGGLARHASDYGTAQYHFQHALGLTRELGHLLDTTLLELELGYLNYYQEGHYAQALELFQRARLGFQQLKDRRGEAQALHALGNVAFAQADLDGASEQYQKALAINREMNIALEAAYNVYQLGLIAQRRQQQKEAEAAYRSALESAEAMEDLGLQAASLHQLGALSLSSGDWETANDYEHRAVELSKKSEDRLTELAARYHLGLLQAQKGDSVAARDVLTEVHHALSAINAPEAINVERALAELLRRPVLYRDFNLHFSDHKEEQGTLKVWVEGDTLRGTMRPEDAITCTYDPKAFRDIPSMGRDGLLDRLERRRLDKEGMFAIGKLLADLALPEGRVRNLFRQSIAALKEGEGVRLRLHITTAMLERLPWELIALPQEASETTATDFLALRRDISIVRTNTYSDNSLMRNAPHRAIARVIGVLSNPYDQPELELERDRVALEQAVEALNRAAGQLLIEVKWAERPSTREALRKVLSDGADIFHFVGHTQFDSFSMQGQIVLERAQDGGDIISDYFSGEQLASLLVSAGVRLAIFGAHELDPSNRDAALTLMHHKVPAVVVNQFKILDTSEVLLASRLFPRVLAGYTIDEALYEARQAIYQQYDLEQRDWAAPVLYLCDQSEVLFPHFETYAADRTLASPFIQVSNTFNLVVGNAIGAQVDIVTGGRIQISNMIDVVEKGAEFTGLKIDELGE